MLLSHDNANEKREQSQNQDDDLANKMPLFCCPERCSFAAAALNRRLTFFPLQLWSNKVLRTVLRHLTLGKNRFAMEKSQMKSFSRLLLPMFLVAFGAVSARADDKSEVLAANTQVEQAFSKLDVKAIEATWAQDRSVSVIHPASKAPILSWEAVQKSYADHPVRYKNFSVVMENPQVTVNGNTAWVVGTEKVSAHRTNGDPLDISALATNIFEKRNGKWLLVHHHASRMP